MRQLIKSALAKAGYELRSINAAAEPSPYALHEYLDYEEYKRIQTEGNRAKLDRVWAVEENIAAVAELLPRYLGRMPTFGICHGTRRGKEQEWFRKYLDCTVIGTEISNTATQFPNTIQWDFHEVKPEWRGAVDFIYSNSFDHSYDPEHCLNQWMSCLSRQGVCVLEHSDLHEADAVTELDPFGASLTFMPYLITKWGRGRYGVRDIVQAPKVNDLATYITLIVVQWWP